MLRSVFFTFLLVLLAACTKVVEVPVTEPDPTEDPFFSTLDFATTGEDQGNGLAVNGNDLFVVGHTEGDLDGPNLGYKDGILRRYNGLKLWGIQFGTRFSDTPHEVAVDNNGYVYVLGGTHGPLGFQVGGRDSFLAKFDGDGHLLWGRQFGSKGSDLDIGLAIDSNNHIYVLSDEGTNNFVIRKFQPDGKLLKTLSVTLNNRPSLAPRALAIDTLNNLIVLTRWNNPGKLKGIDIRLFKYNDSLIQLWQRAYSSPDDDRPFDITTDYNNNIYFTFYRDTAGKGAYFIKKNPNGATLYSRRLEYSPTSSDTRPRSITSDTSNNIYIAGYTSGSFSGFTSAGHIDIVAFKYDSAGNRLWVTQFDDDNYGSESGDIANDIAVGAVNNSLYITGYTWGNLLTGDATGYGSLDAYVAQLNKNNGTIIGVDQ